MALLASSAGVMHAFVSMACAAEASLVAAQQSSAATFLSLVMGARSRVDLEAEMLANSLTTASPSKLWTPTVWMRTAALQDPAVGTGMCANVETVSVSAALVTCFDARDRVESKVDSSSLLLDEPAPSCAFARLTNSCASRLEAHVAASGPSSSHALAIARWESGTMLGLPLSVSKKLQLARGVSTAVAHKPPASRHIEHRFAERAAKKRQICSQKTTNCIWISKKAGLA
eukprot:4056948-Pleurochrysis_carterae.AAC.1